MEDPRKIKQNTEARTLSIHPLTHSPTHPLTNRRSHVCRIQELMSKQSVTRQS